MKKELLVAYFALGAVCIIWGTTYLGLRIGVAHFPPFLFSMVRFFIAGLLLIIITLILGKTPWPNKRMILNQAVIGFFMITLGISIVGCAEVYISSGIAAVICSLMPIWTILINLLIGKDERPSWLIVLGLIIGFSGILLIFGEHLIEFSDSNYRNGIILTIFANLSWAIGSILVKKRNQNTNPFLSSGLQMFFGSLLSIPLSLAFDDYTSIQWSREVLYSLSYMILIGSVAAYACFSYAIKKLPVTIVSLYAYINPIVAVLLGWLILNEKLNTRVGIAIVLIVSGIYIVNKGYQIKNAWKTQLK